MPRRPDPEPTGHGQRSVWSFPRPPALEPVPDEVVIALGGERIVQTKGVWRILETSHPPTYYIPREAFVEGSLRPAEGSSHCEWKGQAEYFDVVGGDRVAEKAAWSYPEPTGRFALIAGHVAVYAGPMDRVLVGEHEVTPQPGGFYGGWITPDLAGPFKGGPGSWGW